MGTPGAGFSRRRAGRARASGIAMRPTPPRSRVHAGPSSSVLRHALMDGESWERDGDEGDYAMMDVEGKHADANFFNDFKDDFDDGDLKLVADKMDALETKKPAA